MKWAERAQIVRHHTQYKEIQRDENDQPTKITPRA